MKNETAQSEEGQKGVWHEAAGGLYDFHTKEKEPRFIVELTQDEYIKTVEALKEK